MTITNRKAVIDILRNKGRDLGDNSMFFPLIYSYVSVFGASDAFALFTDSQYDDMDISPFVKNVVPLMVNGILTKEGTVMAFGGDCSLSIE